ncbi:MAG: hypothetical protein IJR27_04340 [Synergistaceae bacterium]|nr:hypothetical protein [Synergistaceae bacterium]
MKIRRRDTLPQANKVFTDREEPRESFWRLFNKIKAGISEGEDIQVLTYYGHRRHRENFTASQAHGRNGFDSQPFTSCLY